jgi:hypothetical protein
MNDHPLGATDDQNEISVFGNPNGVSPQTKAASVVDRILDLDALLSADVRLAEKSARFSTKPDIEARMEELVAELETLVDSQGRPKIMDASMSDGVRSAEVVSREVNALEDEYAASMVTVRVRQMDEDDWTAFQAKWKTVLAEMPPYPVAFYDELITKSATQPTFTAEQVRGLRAKVGHPAFNAIAQAAWAVNTESGVSVPKSSLSSAVLRHIERG